MVEATKVGLVYPDKISSPGLQMAQIDVNDPLNKKLQEAIKTVYSGTNCIDVEDFGREVNFKELGQQQDIKEETSKTAQQKILISQTYAGGRVEAINSGIYRIDFEYNFFTNPEESVAGYDQIIGSLDQDLEYYVYANNMDKINRITTIEEDDPSNFYPRNKTRFFIENNITNYHEVRSSLLQQLQALREQAHHPTLIKPMIYHLDVSAMYPNIILTNRLQPHGVASD